MTPRETEELLVALTALRASAVNLTHRNLFAQITSGHSDLKDCFESLVLLNEVSVRIFGVRVYSELLVKRISGFSIPTFYPQCHSQFYNAADELKKPMEERKAHNALMRRYDVKDIRAVSIDMMHLKREGLTSLVSHFFDQTEQGYVLEQLYPQEFRPALHSKHTLYQYQIEYYEETLRVHREEEQNFYSNLGLFAIGFPFPPTTIFSDLENNIAKISVPEKGDKAALMRFLEVNSLKSRENLIEALRSNHHIP